MNDHKSAYEDIKDLYQFSVLYQFIRESTGIAITIAYLMMILSSMLYLEILYRHFDISITKLVALEDILATPVKNPDIMLAFLIIVFVLFMIDIGTRFNARVNLKYADKEPHWYIKLLRVLVWSPKTRNANIRMTVIMMIGFLALYIGLFANDEANKLKAGKGNQVDLVVADVNHTQRVTLLGTTSQFVIIYDHKSDQATVIQNESILKFSPIKIDDEPAGKPLDSNKTDEK